MNKSGGCEPISLSPSTREWSSGLTTKRTGKYHPIDHLRRKNPEVWEVTITDWDENDTAEVVYQEAYQFIRTSLRRGDWACVYAPPHKFGGEIKEVRYFFADKTDAAMFKLRFG